MNGICIHETYRTGQTEKQLLKGPVDPPCYLPRAQHRGSLIETAGKGQTQIPDNEEGQLFGCNEDWLEAAGNQGGFENSLVIDLLPHYTFTIILKNYSPSCAT